MPPSRPLLGVGLVLLAVTVLPIMDGLAKHLSARYTIAEVVWARYVFHFVLIAPLALLRHPRAVLGPGVPQQLLRGLFLLIATALFFSAIARMPLADALAVFFVSPLLVTALAAWLLAERVDSARWLAVAAGFAGVVIVIRPGFTEPNVGAALAFGAGVVHALYLLATRRLALTGGSPPLVTLSYTALVGAVVASIVVVPFWSGPPPADLALMVLLGLLAAVGHGLVIAAFGYAPASLLAPLGYAEIVMATAIGFVWFGDLPDAWSWLGIAVIIACGTYVSLRVRDRRPSSVPTDHKG